MTPAWLVVGIVALVIGVVRLSPAVLGVLGAAGTHTPVASRIALRDLARYRSRASAALSAIVLGVAIPVATIVVASAATNGAGDGNLSSGQLLFRIGSNRLSAPQRSPEQLDRLEADLDAFASRIGAGPIAALDAATDPSQTTRDRGGTVQAVVILGRHIGNGLRDLGPLYVANRSTLALLGIDPTLAEGGADVLTSQVGPFAYANTSGRPDDPTTTSIEAPRYSSLPASLITPDAVSRHGWAVTRVAWLVERGTALDAPQRRDARALARSIGLSVEERDPQRALGAIRLAATAIGFLIALGIIALTVGILRVQAGFELATLAANGASSTIRRSLTATTCAALALAGVVLGTLAAYAGLAAGYGGVHQLDHPPLVSLAVLVGGVPATAALASWLVAGKTPTTMATRVAD